MGPMLIIAVSTVNRALALLIYYVSPAFTFWAVWTVILVVLAFLDYRKVSAAPVSKAPDPSAT
jgi:hypothetical protein